ncbi:DUF4333 domain-containing protein [Actinomycetospora callitridis]|jgi:hypothetical protein|uniref:DUF4333 domain-containing protein n=1 Tax=Actinomycetospora callitridis TaxID=913944 RepID=UPI002366F048|nr:DUF4333 domain-containing protein [Actinomycetospora callitridis]MDD7921153.1 DUF4333 domain-containing protein [Actinomycetospora callitridis]
MSQQAPPPPAGFPYPPMPQGPSGMPYGGPPPGPGYGGYPPPPPVRKSSAGKIIGIVVGVFVAILVALFALAMVFGSPTVTADQVEQQIAQQYGVDASQVDCPSSLEGEVGATITCTGTDAGTTSTLLVRVTAVQGDTVNFDIIPQ